MTRHKATSLLFAFALLTTSVPAASANAIAPSATAESPAAFSPDGEAADAAPGAAAGQAAGAEGPDPDDSVKRFHIGNIADFHGHFEHTDSDPGAAYLKCAIDAEAGDLPSILTASGDLVGASPFASAILDDEPSIEVLNQMGLEVSAVGNHEFDKGWADLRDRIIPAAQWDYLGAGVTGSDLQPYSIKELDGVRIAFIGSVTADMPNLVTPTAIEGLTFPDPVAATNQIADELTAADQADVVISLIHDGVAERDAFSSNVDVVFAAHTHQPVSPNLERAPGTPLVMQAGSYSQFLNSVDMSFDPQTGEATVEDAQLIDAETISACPNPDLEIEATVNAALEAAHEEGKEVVATLPEAFYRGSNDNQHPGSNRGAESTLNNLLAEVARWGISTKTGVTADIGVMNAGGVRADLPAGEVTYAEAFAVQPFGNDITYTRLKGSDFKEALEQQWKTDDEQSVLSIGLSDNVSYIYDAAAPQGERIRSITVDGEPLEPDREYVVAGSTFLLEGGDGFTALTKGSERAATGLMDIEAFISYLQENDNPAPRGGQAGVSVTPSAAIAPGQPVELQLASLIYTPQDDASEVTVAIGEESNSAPIERDFGAPGHGEAGTADLRVIVPENATPETLLTVTTDAGTEASAPLSAFGFGA